MDTVDLDEMGLIDGSSTFISDIADSQPILYSPDGTISINSEYISTNGGQVTYVTIPSVVQIVQETDSSHIEYVINNNQLHNYRSVILTEGNFIETVENSANENPRECFNNQISDPHSITNALSIPLTPSKEKIKQKCSNKLSVVAGSSKDKLVSEKLDGDIEPPDKSGSLFCEQCGLEFTSWKLYKKHKIKHLYEKPYKCNVCRETFNYENNLILHLATHDVDNPFCPICKTKFNRVAGLKAHILLHFQEESLFCNECGEEFTNRVYLQEHMREHRGSVSEPAVRKFFKCDICNAKFETFSEKREHHKEFHKSARSRRFKKCTYRKSGSNVCEYCTKCFDKPSQLLRHKRIHTGERPFKCEICSQAFNQKGSLQIHKLKHTRERPYVCQYCKGTFSQKGNLQAHIKRLHLSSDGNERNFKCKLCSCFFRKLGSLNAHFTKAHALEHPVNPSRSELNEKTISTQDNNEKTNVDSSNKENEVDKTSVTHKVFISITGGEDDENSQELNVNPENNKLLKFHSCNYCSKEFKRSSDLMRHIRKHTQEKPFKCKICLKSFAWNSNLAGHLKMHKGMKSFFCSVCSKFFSTSSSLKHHKNRHLKNGENSEVFSEESNYNKLKEKEVATLNEEKCVEETIQSSFVSLDQIDVASLNGNVLLTENGSIVDMSSELEDDEKSETIISTYKCIDCDITFETSSCLKTHRFKNHGDIPYKCKLCPSIFTTAYTLKKHMDIHSSGKYICEHCGKIFFSETSFKKHILSHSPDFPWACPVCGAGFKSYSDCRKHITVHPENRSMNYKPIAAELNVEKEKEVDVLLKGTDDNNQQDQIFGIKNPNGLQTDLKEFIDSLQPGQQFTITANEDGNLALSPIPTEQVDVPYTIIEGKNLFNSSSPSAKQQLYDNSLDNCVFLQSNLEMDGTPVENGITTLLAQNQILERCDVCNLVFANEADYVIHKAMHTQEKPHTCLTCDKSFISAIEYEEHMKLHLKDPPTILEVQEANIVAVSAISAIDPQVSLLRNLTEKKKQRTTWRPPARRLTDEETKVLSAIDSNTASISEKVLLQSLLEKEKYERPVKEEPKAQEKHQNKCKYCPKSFKKPSDLIRHLRTHTGERPFQCTSCHKTFSIKSTASSHMKTHTKDRSFSCFICSKNFATTGSLKIHMRLHTGLKPFSCNLCGAKFRTSGHKKAHLKKHLRETDSEKQRNCNKSEEEHDFLDNIFKEPESLTSKSSNDNEASVNGDEGPQFLIPFNAPNIVTTVHDGKKSLPDYLLNLDQSSNVSVDSPRYLLSMKDNETNEESYIVESNDQIIVTISKGSTAILSSPNQNLPSTSIDEEVQVISGDKFSCSFCKKLFSKACTLFKHIQKYHEETFPCVICGENFKSRADLEVHTLAHELETDFTCTECTKSFALEEDLRSHKCTKSTNESLELALDHELFLFPPV